MTEENINTNVEKEQEEKAQNSGRVVKKEDLFDENGRFKVGHPKVGGREKGSKSFTTKIREALMKIAEGKNYTYEEVFIKAILHKGIVEKDPTIIKLIWNYLDGLPTQKIEGEMNFTKYDWGKYEDNLQAESLDKETSREQEEVENSSST
jgi:hypothetical protein